MHNSLGSFAMALELYVKDGITPLLKVLQGEISQRGAWSGEAPNWANEFSVIRLKILQRQERYEEYLHLARAEGHMKEYLAMLGQLGGHNGPTQPRAKEPPGNATAVK